MKRARNPSAVQGGVIKRRKQQPKSRDMALKTLLAETETKSYVADHNFALATNNWAIVPEAAGLRGWMNYIPQGDGANERDGRKIILKSVHIRMQLVSSFQEDYATVTTAIDDYADQTIRVALVLDTQSNGNIIGAADPFQVPSGNSEPYLAFRDLKQTTRFKFLYDKVHTLKSNWQLVIDPSTTPDTYYYAKNDTVEYVNINYSFPGVGYKLQYDSTDGSAPVNGALYLLVARGTITATSMPNTNIFASCRMRFVG